MSLRQLKAGYFVLTGLNTLATSYFFNYLFFYFHDRFGFGNRENLGVSALHGFIYIFSAWQCGRFAARFGRRLSLKLGFFGLSATMAVGAFLHSVPALLGLVAVYSVVLLLTWPALEALVSERESQSGVQEMVGIYNCTWAGAAAFGYFTGGKLYDALGVGKQHDGVLANTPQPLPETAHTPENAGLNQSLSPAAFLKMAWLANPFAYIAINTLLAVMPGVAQHLALTPTQAGLFCSVWFFGRFGAFALLWQWRSWHYRFRWLLTAFVLLIASLAAILLAQQLWVVVAAQVFFGLATGLIYYSSLFYSMDVGEASSEHGGLHEAFIGAGICLGPATGAVALLLAPQSANAATWAVTGLLTAGLGGLLWLRRQSHKRVS